MEHTNTNRPTNRAQALTQARAEIEQALREFSPSKALAYGMRARLLVGLDGIEEIASMLANENRVEESYMLRGALAALVGEPLPPEIGGEYEEASAYGFLFVERSVRGAWGE